MTSCGRYYTVTSSWSNYNHYVSYFEQYDRPQKRVGGKRPRSRHWTASEAPPRPDRAPPPKPPRAAFDQWPTMIRSFL